jgi:steroid delta-isomerase-like uncharacterized protein
MNAIEVLQGSTKAYNAHDADAVAAFYAEGATYSHPRAGQNVTGEAIMNFFKAVWAAYPDAKTELGNLGDIGGGLVACQWVWRGTNSGTLPDGNPATGRAVTLSGASFVRVEGDKIRSEQVYFDRQDLFEQLGLKGK